MKDGSVASSPLFSDEERAVIALSTELTRDVHVSEETFAKAKGFLNERQLVELVVNVGVANMNNRITEAFWADLPED
ncbi:MAG: hypothetical protein HY071_00665 [Chloroflexi bacterium]|nr:hypothetical protein [Chloroflexota bacterium]